MKITVRQVVKYTAILLSIAALSSIGLVTVFGRYIHAVSEVVTESLSNVHAAGELQKYLRAYSRQNFIFDESGGKKYLRRRVDSVESIREWLKRVNDLSKGSNEEVLANRIATEVEAFLAEARSSKDSSLTPLETFLDDSAKMQVIEEDLERLIGAQVAKAEEIEATMISQNKVASFITLIVGCFVALTCIGLIFWMRRYFYFPLVDLQQAILAFGKGNRNIRATRLAYLPAEISELREQFNDMATTLEQQRDSQLRFLAAIAHDLRNPLSGIQMASTLLLDDTQKPDDWQTYVEMIGRQAKSLDRLVGDLLDTTRIEAGQLDLRLENTDITLIADEVIRLYQTTSKDHILKNIHPTEPLFAYCDPVRLGQVLNNLVSNALKYSPYGGAVTIAIVQHNSNLVISVEDEGMGIQEGELDSIFEPFHRSKTTRETIPGIGLGLSVSRRIVEAHGGTIHVESEPGSGTKFTVHLPVQKSSTQKYAEF